VYYESEREREKKSVDVVVPSLSLSLSLSDYLWQRTEKQRNMRNLGPNVDSRTTERERERMRQKVFKYLLFVLFLVVFIVTQVSGRMEVTKKKRKSTMVGFEQRGACGCCEKDGVKSMNKAVSILNPFNSRTNVFEALEHFTTFKTTMRAMHTEIQTCTRVVLMEKHVLCRRKNIRIF